MKRNLSALLALTLLANLLLTACGTLELAITTPLSASPGAPPTENLSAPDTPPPPLPTSNGGYPVNATATALGPTNTPIAPQATATQAAPATSPVSLPDTAQPPTPFPSENTYRNPKYGFSLSYPTAYELVIVSDEYVELGDKITVAVWMIDPATARGDGPVVENTAAVQMSGYSAQLQTGYIGAVGGYIPQQFRRFIFERTGYYLVLTLYALGLRAKVGEVSQIAPLVQEEVAAFEALVATIQFP